MKQLKHIWIIASGLLIISCQSNSSDESKSLINSDTIPQSKQMGIDRFEEEIKSEPLPIDVAVEMVTHGLNDPFLRIIATRLSHRGHFKSSDLEINEPNSGLVLWPCYNPGGKNGHPEFFLAAEIVEEFNPGQTMPGNEIIMPIRTDSYNRTAWDPGTVRTEVISAMNPISSEPIPAIGGSQVLQYVKAFEELMATFSPIPDNPLCKYGSYYFVNNDSYDRFINERDLVYVSYIMGYAYPFHKPNYYRPILIGLNSDGYPILTNSMSRDEGPFLQKSIPPPPID